MLGHFKNCNVKECPENLHPLTYAYGS